MKVLIVGSGGREHTLAWKISQSPKVDKIYCAPGNAGMAEIGQCIDIDVMDFDSLVSFAEKEGIDLTVVGPDDALAAGIVDAFSARGLRIFGPGKKAAMIESSKVFSKNLMKKYNIPTARYKVCNSCSEAEEYLEDCKCPIVVKADGLALGKGVIICNDNEEAKLAVKEIMEDKKFGSAGNKVVIEEFISGPEVSILAFCDGTTIKPMTSAQDYKRAKDNDEGLNTGGMGTFSPSPFYTDDVKNFCEKYVFQLTMDAMKAEERDFVGILFVGLMLTNDGPKVLEYNARFGDPETQVVLPRLKNDLVEVMEACIDGRLDEIDLEFSDESAVCVVLASDGYPEAYEKGFPIRGLDKFEGSKEYYAFHAGTKLDNKQVLTNGGRVLGVTALGKDLEDARAKAYRATEWIDFDNKYMRRDIAKLDS